MPHFYSDGLYIRLGVLLLYQNITTPNSGSTTDELVPNVPEKIHAP
jgi:hypothetical protein